MDFYNFAKQNAKYYDNVFEYVNQRLTEMGEDINKITPEQYKEYYDELKHELVEINSSPIYVDIQTFEELVKNFPEE